MVHAFDLSTGANSTSHATAVDDHVLCLAKPALKLGHLGRDANARVVLLLQLLECSEHHVEACAVGFVLLVVTEEDENLSGEFPTWWVLREERVGDLLDDPWLLESVRSADLDGLEVWLWGGLFRLRVAAHKSHSRGCSESISGT